MRWRIVPSVEFFSDIIRLTAVLRFTFIFEGSTRVVANHLGIILINTRRCRLMSNLSYRPYRRILSKEITLRHIRIIVNSMVILRHIKELLISRMSHVIILRHCHIKVRNPSQFSVNISLFEYF